MQNLNESHSLAKHQNAARRHIQLCRQNKKGELFITRIEPTYNDLEEKGITLKKAIKSRVAANDTIRLNDLLLDDELRKLHNRAKEYDRENPGENVAKLLFPKGNISPVITIRNKKQPEIVAQIIYKLKSKGTTHALYPFVESIENRVNACNDSQSAYDDNIEAVNLTKTDVELAKANLRRQYTSNYFEAAGQFGKRYAERLFPIISASKSTAEAEVEEIEKEE